MVNTSLLPFSSSFLSSSHLAFCVTAQAHYPTLLALCEAGCMRSAMWGHDVKTQSPNLNAFAAHWTDCCPLKLQWFGQQGFLFPEVFAKLVFIALGSRRWNDSGKIPAVASTWTWTAWAHYLKATKPTDPWEANDNTLHVLLGCTNSSEAHRCLITVMWRCTKILRQQLLLRRVWHLLVIRGFKNPNICLKAFEMRPEVPTWDLVEKRHEPTLVSKSPGTDHILTM